MLGVIVSLLRETSIILLVQISNIQVPGNELPVLDRMMKAQTTDREKTETQVFSVYISIASVIEKRVRSSAQFLIRSASAAYNALP